MKSFKMDLTPKKQRNMLQKLIKIIFYANETKAKL